jgi:hypothetical protein
MITMANNEKKEVHSVLVRSACLQAHKETDDDYSREWFQHATLFSMYLCVFVCVSQEQIEIDVIIIKP